MPNTTSENSSPNKPTGDRPNYRVEVDGAEEDLIAEDLADAVEQARAWVREGDWEVAAGNTEEIEFRLGEIVYDEDGEVDEEATWDGLELYGVYISEPPEGNECEAAEDKEHSWYRPWELVGGNESNPGCFNQGGTCWLQHSVCGSCGCYLRYTETGEQRNYGEPAFIEEISPRDEASEAWLRERWEDDAGELPQWLRDFLGDEDDEDES